MIAKTAALQGVIDPGVAADQSLLAIMFAVLPTGLLGLFLAGVLAAQMSTLDSYCLIAGGNISYDIYRPLIHPKASDKQLVRMTRIGVVIAWVGGAAMALSFGQILGLWVFMASFLISAVFVPIMIGLYVPAWRIPLAGFLSSIFGLATVILFNAIIVFAGDYIDVAETYVLAIYFAGMSWNILQEYVMLFSVPASIVGFLVGLFIDKVRSS
jgi:Na+/proline symporter